MYKKNIFISLFLLLALITVTSLSVFIIDPFQHYRKAMYYKPYSFDQRYMIWGMINHYKYDSIIVGTSMTENFIKSNVDKELNLKF